MRRGAQGLTVWVTMACLVASAYSSRRLTFRSWPPSLEFLFT